MSARTTPKKKAWYWCSRFCRLRDAISYCKEHNIDISQFNRVEDLPGKCCTCGKVGSWLYMDAGHFKGRGLAGGSGAYFDERNVNLQCKQCNGFKQGAYPEYEEFLIDKYGPDVIDALTRKHVVPIDMRTLAMKATEMYYNDKYKELVKGVTWKH